VDQAQFATSEVDKTCALLQKPTHYYIDVDTSENFNLQLKKIEPCIFKNVAAKVSLRGAKSRQVVIWSETSDTGHFH